MHGHLSLRNELGEGEAQCFYTIAERTHAAQPKVLGNCILEPKRVRVVKLALMYDAVCTAATLYTVVVCQLQHRLHHSVSIAAGRLEVVIKLCSLSSESAPEVL